MTALLAESEGIGKEQGTPEQADDLDGLFDDDNDEEEEYQEGVDEECQDTETKGAVEDLFGDVDDIENEDRGGKQKGSAGQASESLNKSKEDLQGL